MPADRSKWQETYLPGLCRGALDEVIQQAQRKLVDAETMNEVRKLTLRTLFLDWKNAGINNRSILDLTDYMFDRLYRREWDEVIKMAKAMKVTIDTFEDSGVLAVEAA